MNCVLAERKVVRVLRRKGLREAEKAYKLGRKGLLRYAKGRGRISMKVEMEI